MTRAFRLGRVYLVDKQFVRRRSACPRADGRLDEAGMMVDLWWCGAIGRLGRWLDVARFGAGRERCLGATVRSGPAAVSRSSAEVGSNKR